MREEILINDIYSAAVEKERISNETERDKWRVLEYECAEHSGRLLLAGANTTPMELTLRLSASGRYRIYLGMLGLRGAQTVSSLRLSDTDVITEIGPTSEFEWTPIENMVEIYWKSEVLDGLSLILSKPGDYLPHSSSLAWIRLVPEEEKEAEKPKIMAYHLDSDYFADEDYTSPESACGRIDILSDGGARLILQEVFATSQGEDYDADPQLYPRAAKYRWYHKNKSEAESALIKRAHGIGAEIYAAYRVESTQFVPPNDMSGINILFPDSFSDLGEYRCVARDGRVLGIAKNEGLFDYEKGGDA